MKYYILMILSIMMISADSPDPKTWIIWELIWFSILIYSYIKTEEE